MIAFLAKLFRQVHLIVGITAPPPGSNERTFVFIWLSVIALVIIWSALVLYLMVRVF